MILVTGANGLIGRAVVKLLRAGGQAVREHTRKELDFAEASQSDFDRLADGCDAVVHGAALVHNPTAPDELFGQLNIRPTRCLANASAKAGVRTFVFMSTSAVYGESFCNVDETRDKSPVTAYGRSKDECEELLYQLAPAPRLVVLRPSLVFGEGDRGNMLSLIKQINAGLYVNVSHNAASKSVIYSQDVAAVVRLCLTQLQDGQHVFNLANPEPVLLNDLAGVIAECLGKQSPNVVPATLLKAGARIGEALLGKRSPLTMDRLRKLTTSTTLSVERLVAATGFTPEFTLKQSIEREIAWAREVGALQGHNA